jgi:hypothetical protein
MASEANFDNFINDYDDWVCGYCQYGDSDNGFRSLHRCGNHYFHTTCLNNPRNRDSRCPVCRLPHNTVPVFYSDDSQETISSSDSGYGGPRGPPASFSTARPVLMPFRNTNRITPQFLAEYGEGICCYCGNRIWESQHHYLRQCRHRIHTNCMLDNMFYNGINNAGELYCPQCRGNNLRVL